MLADRGFDQPRRKTELRKCRLQFIHQIGLQRGALPGVLAFGLIGDPSIEFADKITGMQVLMRPGDGVNSGHGCFLTHEASQRIEIRRMLEEYPVMPGLVPGMTRSCNLPCQRPTE
jgi:hypothetical protein